MALFGGPRTTVLDDRVAAALAKSYGDKGYEKYQLKMALKEQSAVLANLQPDEHIVFIGNGEGLGHAGIVLHMSAIVVTTQRMLVIRGGKVRQALVREDVKKVSTGQASDGLYLLQVVGPREIIGFEFKSIQRRDALMRALGHEPVY
ncbi:MAG: hypothetical protein JHD16_00785 [Solirubrobacteraceae bacterium]|nr:hypothetical protein [Solirubrobacteraceae bacterium]